MAKNKGSNTAIQLVPITTLSQQTDHSICLGVRFYEDRGLIWIALFVFIHTFLHFLVWSERSLVKEIQYLIIIFVFPDRSSKYMCCLCIYFRIYLSILCIWSIFILHFCFFGLFLIRWNFLIIYISTYLRYFNINSTPDKISHAYISWTPKFTKMCPRYSEPD